MEKIRWLVLWVCIAVNSFCMEAFSVQKEVPPCFVATTMQQLEVVHIDAMPDRTELVVMMWGKPGEPVVIDSRMALEADGRSYRLTEVQNHSATSEGNFFPKTGEVELALLFPPLPEGTLSVNLTEGSSRGQIWGLQLKGNEPYVYIPSFLTTREMDFDQPLPFVEMNTGRVVINGYLLGYSAEMQVDVNLRVHDWLFADEWGHPVRVNDDGSFHIEVNLLTACGATLYVNHSQLQLFLLPGDEMMAYVNLPVLSMSGSRLHEHRFRDRQKAWYDSRAAALNTELATYGYPLSAYSKEETGKELCDMLEADREKYVWHNFVKERNRIQKDKRLSEACRSFLLVNLEMEAFVAFARDGSLNPISSGQLSGKLLKLPFSESPYIGYGRSYFAYLQTVEQQYKEHLPLPDYWADLKQVYPMCQQIKKNCLLSGDDKHILGQLSHKAIAQYILSMNHRLETEIRRMQSADGVVVIEMDSLLTGKQVMKQLAEDFHGNTLIVDFWGTWCAPCRKSLPAMDRIKRFFTGKPCVFLYLTGPNSPKEEWSTAISSMHGVHVRLTRKQWEELGALYGITGIPAYLIVDRNGKIYRQYIGFPGMDVLKRTISETLD